MTAKQEEEQRKKEKKKKKKRRNEKINKTDVQMTLKIVNGFAGKTAIGQLRRTGRKKKQTNKQQRSPDPFRLTKFGFWKTIIL
jgi:hypothetical protein